MTWGILRSNMPRFTLQYAAFQNAISIVSEAEKPRFAKRGYK